MRALSHRGLLLGWDLLVFKHSAAIDLPRRRHYWRVDRAGGWHMEAAELSVGNCSDQFYGRRQHRRL